MPTPSFLFSMSGAYGDTFLGGLHRTCRADRIIVETKERELEAAKERLRLSQARMRLGRSIYINSQCSRQPTEEDMLGYSGYGGLAIEPKVCVTCLEHIFEHEGDRTKTFEVLSFPCRGHSGNAPLVLRETSVEPGSNEQVVDKVVDGRGRVIEVEVRRRAF